MKKLLNNPWVVGLLVAAAIVFVARSALRPDRPAAPDVASYPDEYTEDFGDDGTGEPAATVAGGIPSVHQALEALAAAPPAADPFGQRIHDPALDEPGTEPEGDLQVIHLSAIWLQGPQTLLLVNNRIQAAGDVIGELTIASPTLDSTCLTHPDGRDFIAVGNRFQRTTTGHSRDPEPTLAFHEN